MLDYPQERKIFAREKANLLPKYEGQYILIVGQTPEIFPTLDDALQAGIKKTGSDKFFAAKLTREPDGVTEPVFATWWR